MLSQAVLNKKENAVRSYKHEIDNNNWMGENRNKRSPKHHRANDFSDKTRNQRPLMKRETEMELFSDGNNVVVVIKRRPKSRVQIPTNFLVMEKLPIVKTRTSLKRISAKAWKINCENQLVSKHMSSESFKDIVAVLVGYGSDLLRIERYMVKFGLEFPSGLKAYECLSLIKKCWKMSF